MKTTVEKLSPTRAKLTISVTPEELKPSITHAYGHIAEQVNIPGFRKGKVPPPIIDQRVGKAAVLEHAVNEGLDGFYRQAVEENDLRPLGRPEADITELTRMGVARIFTPGASTHAIVDWVHSNLAPSSQHA